jgi:deoxyribose-phosphate aldolase
MNPAELARLIDHTLLKPETTRAQMEQLCREALQYGFASVCVNACHVPQAADALRESEVSVCAVAGFPLGATLTSVKVYEANEAIRSGAREIDMVINIGALKSADDPSVEADIRSVADACHRLGAICKAIIETGLLTTDEKARACRAAMRAGADFVKTSTGFGHGGATADDVRMIRGIVGPEMGVKASGGIRTLRDCQEMLAAGATRIGTSSGVSILRESAALARGNPR